MTSGGMRLNSKWAMAAEMRAAKEPNWNEKIMISEWLWRASRKCSEQSRKFKLINNTRPMLSKAIATCLH